MPAASDAAGSKPGDPADSGPGDTARLFLALWPDAATAQHLRDCAAGLQRMGFDGQWVRPDNLHLTLVFLGNIPKARHRAIEEVAAAIAGARFRFSLDEARLWAGNGILCLAPRESPTALTELATNLTSRLQAAGFRIETRTFRAHLTLARRGRGPARRIVLQSPVTWEVDHYCLVESRLERAGARYSVRRTWPLA